MATYVALLRAVNLGPTNKVAMADLRALLERLGYGDVRTLQLAGNAVFTSTGRSAAKHERDIEAALVADLDLKVRVLVRSATELADVVGAQPFPLDEPKRLHVVFLSGQPHGDAGTFAPDEYAFGERVVYVRLAQGVQGSRLPNWEKVLGYTATMRTWGTVTRLLALARAT